MESYIWWTPLQSIGLEQLHLVENEKGVVADSLMLGVEDTTPFRLSYQVWADNDWNVRECLLQTSEANGKTLHLYSDGQGHWQDAAGTANPTSDGCMYIDITHTPFTNTLPIRHLALEPGESNVIDVAYISVPDLSFRPVQQRYTCLSTTTSGAMYRYEGLDSGFTAELPVDERGLVVDYPGLWKRIEMR